MHNNVIACILPNQSKLCNWFRTNWRVEAYQRPICKFLLASLVLQTLCQLCTPSIAGSLLKGCIRCSRTRLIHPRQKTQSISRSAVERAKHNKAIGKNVIHFPTLSQKPKLFPGICICFITQKSPNGTCRKCVIGRAHAMCFIYIMFALTHTGVYEKLPKGVFYT